MNKNINPFFSLFSVIAVSVYLLLVGSYLILTGKIKPSMSLWTLIKVRFRPKKRGGLEQIQAETGHCFTAKLPQGLISDQEGFSRLVLFENGVPLTRGHVTHDEIRQLGQGLYSHWGDAVYFSASDNSSPNSNGRTYTFAEV